MEPVFIYFKEIALDEDNKFTLEFSQTGQIYKVHFSSKKDYFITSMNCNLALQEDLKNTNVLDEIKELSEKSRLLLEKDPTYQNDIKTVFLWKGVPGSISEKINFNIVLSAAHINLYSWHYKLYDVKEKKIRDCKIYSPYEHFKNRDFISRILAFTNGATYHVGLNEYLDQRTGDFLYKRYLFNFQSSDQDRNLFFILDPKKDEFIGSDPNYHFAANDRFLRNGERVPKVKNFLLNFYTQWRSQNKIVIVNKNIWDRANPKEKILNRAYTTV